MSYLQHMLSQNEKVLFVGHQHWISLVSSGLQNLLIALVVTVAAVLAQVLLPPEYGELRNLAIVLGVVLLLLPAIRFILDFVKWDSREFVVTNRRVIQLSGVMNRSVTDYSLEKVNDVRMNQTLIGRMMNYGDVQVLTANEEADRWFRRLASPIKFKTAMLDAKEALISPPAPPAPMEPRLPGGLPANPSPRDVPALIDQLDQLRRRGTISEEEFQRKKSELLSRI